MVVARTEKKADGSGHRRSMVGEREEQWLFGGLEMREKEAVVREREKRERKKIIIILYKIWCLYCVSTFVSSYHNWIDIFGLKFDIRCYDVEDLKGDNMGKNKNLKFKTNGSIENFKFLNRRLWILRA